MLIWYDPNKKIYASNELIGPKEAQQYLSSNCVWIDEEINFPQVQENQTVEMYLNEDNIIKYEIVEVLPPQEPTTAEKIDYLVTDALDKDEVALDQTLMLLNIQLNQELSGGGETL